MLDKRKKKLAVPRKCPQIFLFWGAKGYSGYSGFQVFSKIKRGVKGKKFSCNSNILNITITRGFFHFSKPKKNYWIPEYPNTSSPFTNGAKDAPKQSPSRFPAIFCMFRKIVFPMRFSCKISPEILDNAFLRLYLCSVVTHHRFLFIIPRLGIPECIYKSPLWRG